MTININISYETVMGLVEGLSVTIAQENDGAAPFEQMWASEDERRKLDIYYREAVNDLERHLSKWLDSSSEQYHLNPATNEGDYSLTIIITRHWPIKLQGLLENKVQDYLVHSVLAGWLNNFTGLEIKADYATIAGQDLSDVKLVLMQRAFDFAESYRKEDDYQKNQIAARQRVIPRKKDFMPVKREYEQTDWSGEEGRKGDISALEGERGQTVIITREPGIVPPHHHEHHHIRPEFPPEDPNDPTGTDTSGSGEYAHCCEMPKN